MKFILFLLPLFLLSANLLSQNRISSQSVFYHDYANRPMTFTRVADNNSSEELSLIQDHNLLLKPGQEYQFQIVGLEEGDFVTVDQRNPYKGGEEDTMKHTEYLFSLDEIRTFILYTSVEDTNVISITVHSPFKQKISVK